MFHCSTHDCLKALKSEGGYVWCPADLRQTGAICIPHLPSSIATLGAGTPHSGGGGHAAERRRLESLRTTPLNEGNDPTNSLVGINKTHLIILKESHPKPQKCSSHP